MTCEADPRGVTNPTSGPVPTGILILRAWLEGDPPTNLRARLTTTAGVAESENALTVVASVEGVCEAVRLWLAAFVETAAAG